MKQWKHPGKGDRAEQVVIHDRSPRVQSAIILPEREHNRELTEGLESGWSEDKGPGPGLRSGERENRTEGGQTGAQSK